MFDESKEMSESGPATGAAPTFHASLLDNPFSSRSVASSCLATAIAPLAVAALGPPVQTFKFNFAAADDEEQPPDDDMGGEPTTDFAAGAPSSSAAAAAFSSSASAPQATLTRPTQRHSFAEAAQLPTIDEVELLTLNASTSTFSVHPLTAGLPAPSSSSASSSPLHFYKRRSSGLGAHSASLKAVLNDHDLVPAVYEGGFKVWECAVDLLLFMQNQMPSSPSSASSSGGAAAAAAAAPSSSAKLFPHGLHGGRVAELGCGHAFPALYALLIGGARHVCMQDYNAEVVRDATIDNARLSIARPRVVPTRAPSTQPQQEEDAMATDSAASTHTPPTPAALTLEYPSAIDGPASELAARCSFVSGDWSDPALLECMGAGSYDLVLTSDTLYSSGYMAPLFDLITRLLSPEHGIALIAAKRYYFGIGGSTLEFMQLVRQRGRGRWQCEVVHEIEDGKSNIREILLLRRAQTQAQQTQPQQQQQPYAM